MSQVQLRSITAEEMRIGAAGVTPLPVEQSAIWEQYEAVEGRKLWGRLEYCEEGKRIALVALYEYSMRGARYLWAKHGPVWLKEATPARERAFRDALARYVREKDSSVVFIRLHATFSADDLRDVMQIITYDRTVIIRSHGGDEEKVLADMTKEGRRQLRRSRKALAQVETSIADEREAAAQDFSEYYEVLKETAQRDGFHPHPPEVYATMLKVLGEQHSHLYVLRVDGKVAAWNLILVNDRQAECYYGATTALARKLGAMPELDVQCALILGPDLDPQGGIDLMGMHSPRVPELFTVGKYKLNFAKGYTDVPGAWDLPLRPRLYAGLRNLLSLKRALRS